MDDIPSVIESTVNLPLTLILLFRGCCPDGKKTPCPAAVLGLESRSPGLGGIGPKGFEVPDTDREKLSDLISRDCARAPVPR